MNKVDTHIPVEETIQNNKLEILGKLTASLIHEIRNPLSAIKLNLDYLQMLNAELPDDVNESVSVSFDALNRIQYLIENLLAFSRKKQDCSTFNSINEVTNYALDILENLAKSSGVELIRELDKSLNNVLIDNNVFLQVFINLITNAMEACNEKGRVIVRTFRDELNVITWEVEDNGEAIPDELKQKIFNDFFTTKQDGTGLGLSVCKMLLDKYNSSIQFESTQGKGSKFFIKINQVSLRETDEI